jgi:hypothetical protein
METVGIFCCAVAWIAPKTNSDKKIVTNFFIVKAISCCLLQRLALCVCLCLIFKQHLNLEVQRCMFYQLKRLFLQRIYNPQRYKELFVGYNWLAKVCRIKSRSFNEPFI